jgi:hypothetical protein
MTLAQVLAALEGGLALGDALVQEGEEAGV